MASLFKMFFAIRYISNNEIASQLNKMPSSLAVCLLIKLEENCKKLQNDAYQKHC